MYNVSEFFYSKVKEPSRDIDAKVIIGDTELGTEEIIEFTIDSSFGNDEMPVIGSCIAKEMKLKLINDENILPETMINVPIKPWVAIKVNDEYEWVPMGTFYATTGDITKTDLEVEISSFDIIGYLSNSEIETDLSYPTDVLNLIEEIEDKYSITINRNNIQPYEIPVKPKGKLRTILGYIASLFTCNCITNLEGEVAFVTITDTEHTEFSLEHYFQSQFYVTETTRSIEYDIFQLNSDQFIDFKLLNEAPVQFTKLMVEKESPETEGEEDPEDKNLYFGTANGFTVSIENDFIETEEQLQVIYERKYPLTFVPYELNLQGMPHLEVGDNIRLIDDKHDDREPVVRNLIIGEHKFTYNGSLVSKIVMTSPRTESDTIDNTSTSQVVQTIRRNTPDMSDAIDNATSIITGNEGGHIVTRFDENNQPYEMLIMNTDDIDTATRVWRWNQGGLGYSSEGYDGKYALAMTSDGAIVADFITTGVLNASVVSIGSETSFEEGYDPSEKVDSSDLGDMAYENAVEKAKLGNTIIDGGYLVTGMIDASRIDTGVLNAERVSIGPSSTFEEGYDPSGKVNSSDLGNLAYEDAVEKSKLGSTIIDGGYITTGMIDASRIDTGVLNAERIRIGSASNFEEGYDPSDKVNESQVTIITEDTIKSTNVIAENLKVDSANIQGRLTASQLLIQAENLVPDPHLDTDFNLQGDSNDGGSSRGWDTISSASPFSGDRVLRYRPNAEQDSHAWQYLGGSVDDQKEYFRAKQGDVIYAECWIRRWNAGANTSRIRLVIRDKDGNILTGFNGNNIDPTTTYRKSFVVSDPLPEGAYYFNVQARVLNGNIENNGNTYFDGFMARKVTDLFRVGDPDSKVEISTDGNAGFIEGYSEGNLRFRLQEDAIEFHKDGSKVAQMKSYFESASVHGSTVGDTLVIESMGNAITFNSSAGSTDPSMVVWPNWVDIPTLNATEISIGNSYPANFWMHEDSSSNNFEINSTMGSRLMLSNTGTTARLETLRGAFWISTNVGIDATNDNDIRFRMDSTDVLRLTSGGDIELLNDLGHFSYWGNALTLYPNRADGTTFRIRSHNNRSDFETHVLYRADRSTRFYGDLQVDGDKNVVQNTKSYGKRLMNALETPDSRFVAYQEYTLSEGEHWIDIEPMYLETISDYFIVPHIQNASEVVMLERREGKFRVWVHGHTAEVVFEINGKRKGFEDVYMKKLNDLEDDGDGKS